MNIIPFKKAEFTSSLDAGDFYWTKHVLQRLIERNITQAEVVQVLKSWDILEQEPTRTPYPTMLFMGWLQQRPIHVSIAWDETKNRVYIITVYEPDAAHFDPPDFRKRKHS